MSFVILISESLTFSKKFGAKISDMGYICLSVEEAERQNIDLKESLLVIDIESSLISFGELTSLMEEFSSSVLVLSPVPAFEEGYPMLRIGVRGYANKHIGSVHLQSVLQVLFSGGTWYDPGFMNDLIRRVDVGGTSSASKKDLVGVLSEREYEIARYVAQGLSNHQIAEMIDITERTVKAHLLSSYKKLGINDRVSFALWVKEAYHA